MAHYIPLKQLQYLTAHNRTNQRACSGVDEHPSHGSTDFFWQRAKPIIVGRFTGRTWKNNGKRHT